MTFLFIPCSYSIWFWARIESLNTRVHVLQKNGVSPVWNFLKCFLTDVVYLNIFFGQSGHWIGCVDLMCSKTSFSVLKNSLALQYSQINLLWLFAKLETAFRIESNAFLSIVSSRAGFLAVNLKLDRLWVWSFKLVVCLCLQDLCFFNSSLLLKQLPHW